MKTRIIFIAIIILFFTSGLQAQTQQQTNNLATLAKLWGFLKYYHPEAAKGKPDWDAELINMQLTIKKVEDNQSFNKLLIKWYQSLPKSKISDTSTQIEGDSILRVFDESDIGKYDVPAALKKNLYELYRYHLPDSSRYINNKDRGYTYDFIFHNEDMMEKPAYPDEAHRYLALVRFWNIINYFYPHKKQNAPDWDKALINFIPQFLNAANAGEYRAAFYRLTTQIHDNHSWFLQKDWNRQHGDFINVPFDTYYAGGKFVIGYSKYDSLMKAADLKIGDEIVAINNLPVTERVKQIMPYTTGTNSNSLYRDLGRNLFRIDSNKSINITLDRNGKRMGKKIKLYTYGELYQYKTRHRPKITEDLGQGIYYARICEVGDLITLQKMYADIKDAKAVILEMRDYPPFNIVQAMWPGLVAKRTPSEIDYTGVLEFPGMFKAHIDQIPASPDTLKLPMFKGRLIVLVNEQTQSLAESVAMELRMRPNTIIMGRQTAGTTGNMVRVDIPGGIQGSYTAVKVIGINGNFEEGKGVKLDREIELTAEKIRSADDYLLEQAYREAKQTVQ